MGFSGEIIGGIIGAVISGIIAILISLLSIKAERKERYKEKLQDRKDTWLDTHYRELSIEFKNLINFNSIKVINVVEDAPILKGYYQILETSLVAYHFESSCIKIKIELNNMKEIYKNIVSHLEHGYPNVYNKLEELWKAENKYKDSLLDAFDEILKRIVELMKNNFNNIQPSLENIGKNTELYNIKVMFKALIFSIIENSKLDYYPENSGAVVYPKLYNDDAIVHLNKKCYEKFKENVWEVLKKEFENKIKSLNDNCNNLSKLESKFRDTINNIIDDYDSGHIIEGYCDVCNKIYHENDITKLRPKV